MDSYSARANTIFCTFATVLGTAAFCNHMSSKLPNMQATPVATVKLNTVHDLTVNTYLGMDQSMFSFDYEHDLSTEFHWNMNMLFMYLVASYNDTSNVRNEVTIWDAIVADPVEAVAKREKMMVEYPLRDQFRELRGRKLDLQLRYRTMPITGVMGHKIVASSIFEVPKEYFRDESASESEPKKRRRQRDQKKKQVRFNDDE
eukprot:TRINITY_DN57363_c0_g1_i1.p1 TRINITY_DN57363_c0_g1~~TRINITY_DN57363_c0_g1_i1.p1  ORF type:complete len:202 (+),score=60.75 TRINITY_DN57363_c0_g1_i1:99-704(+)